MKTSKLSKARETASLLLLIGWESGASFLDQSQREEHAWVALTTKGKQVPLMCRVEKPWVFYSLFWGYAVVAAKHLVLCLFLGNCSASNHDLRGERQALQWPTPLLIRKSLTPLYHLPLWSASGIWPVALSTLQVCGNQTRWLVWLWWLPLRRDDNILAATEGAANKVNHYKKKKDKRSDGKVDTDRLFGTSLQHWNSWWHVGIACWS